MCLFLTLSNVVVPCVYVSAARSSVRGDYLNEQGEVVDDKDGAKKRELIGIFDAARKVLVG